MNRKVPVYPPLRVVTQHPIWTEEEWRCSEGVKSHEVAKWQVACDLDPGPTVLRGEDFNLQVIPASSLTRSSLPTVKEEAPWLQITYVLGERSH